MKALLLERHPWETSGASHQIQIPKTAFTSFFVKPGSVNVYVWAPRTVGVGKKRKVLLSYYEQSDTYRFNWLTEFGTLGHSVVIFEESGDLVRPYNVWWFTKPDTEKLLKLPFRWRQAKASQYGPGRKWAIIQAPAPRRLSATA